MEYTTQAIRNVGLFGQAGAGKTLLLEALLLEAGAIRNKGNLLRGTTVSDFDEQERRLHHSLDTAICGFDHDAIHVNLIDTPCYPDFLGRTLSVLEAVETAAVVVSATSGVDSITQQLMDFAQERELCRLVIVNKIDCHDAKPAEVLQQIREVFGAQCLPLNLPAASGQALREGHLIPVCFVSAETGAGVAELLRIFERLMPNPTEGNPPPFRHRPRLQNHD
jgi:elongation factor G